MSNCLHALTFWEALLWAIVGSISSWVVVVVGPWTRRAYREVREGKLRLSANPHLLLPAAGILLQLSVLGLIGAAIGEPTTWRDGLVWGLGAQSLAAGLVGAPGR